MKLYISKKTGFPVLRFDADILRACLDNTVGLKKYRMAAKPPLGSDSSAWRYADCSGFIDWILSRACLDKLPLPLSGSANMWDWCKRVGLKETIQPGQMDGRIRIGFIPETSKHAGHVWGIHNGLTIESYSRHGAGRRPWDTKVLMREVGAVYVLTDEVEI